jgi:hypothetical protein
MLKQVAPLFVIAMLVIWFMPTGDPLAKPEAPKVEVTTTQRRRPSA